MTSLAIIGAGAVAEYGYLPGIDRHPRATIGGIVDTERERAVRLATAFDADRAVTDHTELLDEVDGAIIATPPSTHAAITADCLTAGVAVLAEKPLATDRSQAADLVTQAESTNTMYAISRQLRDSPASRLAHLLISGGVIGKPVSFTLRYGDRTEWDFASGYRVDPDRAWGGVLADKAPHALDLLCWLFPDPPRVVAYEDDTMGGLEANAQATLQFGTNGPTGDLRVTASKGFANELTVTGPAGSIVTDPKGDTVVVDREESEEPIELTVASGGEYSRYRRRLWAQVDRFVDALQGCPERIVPAETGVTTLGIIEDCYSQRSQGIERWERPGLVPEIGRVEP